MPYTNARDVIFKTYYFAQLGVNVVINGLINGVLAYGTYSNWGSRKEPATWPGVWVWKMNSETNSCAALDIILTCFFIGCMCTLFGTGGVMKDVKDKKVDIMDTAVTKGGWWRFTPVRIENLCMRALAQGLYAIVWGGVPTLIIFSLALQGDSMSGLGFTVFKALWAAFFLAIPIFTVAFFAGMDARHFPELEFESLMRAGGLGVTATGSVMGGPAPPPLVAGVGHV